MTQSARESQHCWPLSLSCRIAEGFLSKEEAILTLPQLADLAVAAGYDAICMRASQVGIHTDADVVQQAAEIVHGRGLGVSMVTGDFAIVYNNDRGPDCLTKITPYLQLAETLGANMIRVCLRTPADISHAQRAADEAAERSIRLVHQCHAQSLFETVDQIIDTLTRIDRPNFGLIYDAANLEECRQEYGPATIARLAPWIVNVYLQNQRLSSSGAVTLNTWCHGPISFDIIQPHEPGGIDFHRIFRGLRQIGYSGPITVHQSAPEDPGTTPLTAAAKTAEFLRSL